MYLNRCVLFFPYYAALSLAILFLSPVIVHTKETPYKRTYLLSKQKRIKGIFLNKNISKNICALMSLWKNTKQIAIILFF